MGEAHTVAAIKYGTTCNVTVTAKKTMKGSKPKSQSEILEEETLKMEAKLRVLKAEMAKQRAEAEVYAGGSREGGQYHTHAVAAVALYFWPAFVTPHSFCPFPQTPNEQRRPMAQRRAHHRLRHSVRQGRARAGR